MKKYLLLLILLNSCVSNVTDEKNIKKIKFTENMSFEEFKIKLKVYSDESQYPNIDN